MSRMHMSLPIAPRGPTSEPPSVADLTRDFPEQPMKVQADYLELLKLPKQIYQYAIEHGRVIRKKKQREEQALTEKEDRAATAAAAADDDEGIAAEERIRSRKLKSGGEKRALAEAICKRLVNQIPLHENTWATDYRDFIWTVDKISEKALASFNQGLSGSFRIEKENRVVEEVEGARVKMHPETGILTLEGDGKQLARRIFQQVTADSDSRIDLKTQSLELTKVFNAFLTTHLNAPSQATVVRVGSNRYFKPDAPQPTRNPDGSFQFSDDWRQRVVKSFREDRDGNKSPQCVLFANNGFLISTRPGADSPLINVNTSAATFHASCNLSDFILDRELQIHTAKSSSITNQAARDLRTWKQTIDALIGLQVRVDYSRGSITAEDGTVIDLDDEKRRLKRITGSGTSASTQTFAINDGASISVERWLSTERIVDNAKMPITLAHSQLPCVNVGGSDKKTARWYPPECLSIVANQFARPRFSQKFPGNVLKVACRQPDVNVSEIVRTGLPLFKLPRMSAQKVQTRPLFESATALLEVEGNWLHPPLIEYLKGSTSPKIEDGSWSIENTPFFFSGLQKRFTINCFGMRGWTPDMTDYELTLFDRFHKNMILQIALHGRTTKEQLTVLPLEGIQGSDDGPELVRRIRARKPSCDLAVIMLPDKGSYPAVRRAADLDHGIKAVFMRAEAYWKHDPDLPLESVSSITADGSEDIGGHSRGGRGFDRGSGGGFRGGFSEISRGRGGNRGGPGPRSGNWRGPRGLSNSPQRGQDRGRGGSGSRARETCCGYFTPPPPPRGGGGRGDRGGRGRGDRGGRGNRGERGGAPSQPNEGGRSVNVKQLCSNIAMKLNIKAGGVNHRLSESVRERFPMKGPLIVMGADVTHPGPGATPGCPSIACLVASISQHQDTFPGSMRLQKGKQEKIEELEEMVTERLLAYRNHEGKLPKQMLFFRDGVSESQYYRECSEEVELIRHGFENACNDTGQAAQKMELLYVVCGKRHNTRFFAKFNQAQTPPMSLQAGTVKGRRNNNLRPGLVVDEKVTLPSDNVEFFLQSHAAIQGTARPAHYFTIVNDPKVSAEGLQFMTNAFCWNYAKATKAVSYAAPAYYADKLCDRGRVYLDEYLTGRRELVEPPEKGASKEDVDFWKLQCVQHVKENATECNWRRRVGPGPWHRDLDNIMLYL